MRQGADLPYRPASNAAAAPEAAGSPARAPAGASPVAAGSRFRFPLLVYLAGVAVSLVATAALSGFHTLEPRADEEGYYNIAVDMAEGRGFDADREKAVYRTPPWPALLALLFTVTGPSVAAGKVLNCLLGGLTPLGIYYLGRQLFGQRRAELAALVSVCFPTLFIVNTTLYSESLSTAAFVWFNVYLVYLLRHARRAEKGGAAFSAPMPAPTRSTTPAPARPSALSAPSLLLLGVLMGALAFIKPQHAIFVALLAPAAAWYFRRSPLQLFKALGLSALGFCLVLAPWWVHNWRLTGGKFIPFTTSGDRTLVDANNPTIAGMYRFRTVGGRQVWEGAGKFLMDLEENQIVDMDFVNRTVEWDRAPYYRARAVGWIKSHPGDFAVLCVKKLGYAFGLWPLWPGSVKTLALNLLFLGVFVVSLPGWARLVARPGPWRVLVLHLLAFLALTLVFFGSWRYRNPFEGSIILVAAASLPASRRLGLARAARSLLVRPLGLSPDGPPEPTNEPIAPRSNSSPAGAAEGGGAAPARAY